MPLKRKKVNKKKGKESKNEFMDRCMHEITNNSDTKRNHDQRIAICLSYWAKNEDNSTLDKINMLLQEEEHECPEGEKW